MKRVSFGYKYSFECFKIRLELHCNYFVCYFFNQISAGVSSLQIARVLSEIIGTVTCNIDFPYSKESIGIKMSYHLPYLPIFFTKEDSMSDSP